MKQATVPTCAALPIAALDNLMPLHVVTSADGQIVGCGPTLTKLLQQSSPDDQTSVPGGASLPGPSLIGQSLFTAFDLRRPHGVRSMADLRAREGERLRLTLRQSVPHIGFRGSAWRLMDGDGMLLNLSFGISLADVVRQFDLTDLDFAPTDLAMEMLFLVEAKSSAISALTNLTERLEGGKLRAEVLAATDALTGLRNRRALNAALDRLTTERVPYGLLHVDLDYFKAVNDTLGHAAGDKVLQVAARVLERASRLGDTVARTGGDEFVLVFPMLTDIPRLQGVARRIIDDLSQPIPYEGQSCRISASVGAVTTLQYDHPRPLQLQSDADEALYEAKRAGRGRVHVHIPSVARRA
jgi:diguanylate cyclase (GGDEF)-like protein